MRISRPRGAEAAAAAAPPMCIVRGGPTGALAPEGARAMREPQEPRNAKVAGTSVPQVGHGISPAPGAAVGDGRGAAGPAATVVARAGPPSGVAPVRGGAMVGLGAGVAAASGLGDSWNEGGAPIGAGI